MSGSVLEFITQTIYFDKEKYSKKEIDQATKVHKNPDPFVGHKLNSSSLSHKKVNKISLPK